MNYATMPPLSGGMPAFVGRRLRAPEEGFATPESPDVSLPPLATLEARLENLVGFSGMIAEGFQDQILRLAGPRPDKTNGSPHPPPPPSDGAINRLLDHVNEIELRLRHIEGRLIELQAL